MAHHLYITEAFIIQTRDSGEHNRVVTFFTRDLGVISAKAQGVRKEISKMRFSLTQYSWLKVTLVRGRSYWRIVGTESIAGISENKNLRDFSAKVAALLLRLSPGESPAHTTFDFISQAFLYADQIKQDAKKLLDLEVVVVLNILYELGYLAMNPVWQNIVGVADLESATSAAALVRSSAIETINQSFHHTQL